MVRIQCMKIRLSSDHARASFCFIYSGYRTAWVFPRSMEVKDVSSFSGLFIIQDRSA